MKISVSVKPNSRVESVEKISENEYVIKVNAPPVDGKANERVIELLSIFLRIPKSKIELLNGNKSKKKVFNIAID